MNTAPDVYQPFAPPKKERRRSELQQALRLPKTLQSIYSIVRQDFAPAVLDGYLWSFWVFHQYPADLRYRVRPWQKVHLRSIEPVDVMGIAIWEMALMLHIAMEDEEPIPEYSLQSGEGFRFLLPTLARFMGKNEEQARFAAENGLQWCEGAWCAEERRHSNTLARLIERLVKRPPRRDNPNRPMVVTASEDDALRHLISRETSEWNASSSYILMAAHATGNLHGMIRNLERDEVKHLCIMSAADAYLLGPRPWARSLDLLRKGLHNYTGQKRSRSGGDVFGTNPVTAVEGIAAHLLTEYFLRKWLKTIPLRTLTTVFETPSSISERGAQPPSLSRQAEIERSLQRGTEKRLGLERWPQKQRVQALAQRRFEEAQEATLRQVIAHDLNTFQGAELPGSNADKDMRSRIRRFTRRDSSDLRQCLFERLRDFQVRHSR